MLKCQVTAFNVIWTKMSQEVGSIIQDSSTPTTFPRKILKPTVFSNSTEIHKITFLSVLLAEKQLLFLPSRIKCVIQ